MNLLRATVVILAVLLSVYALGCKNDKTTNPGGGGGGAADHTIQIIGFAGANSYSPDTDSVTVGTTVAWHNQDGTAHTATSNTTGTGAFDTHTVSSGGTSAAIAMNTAGTFPYHCTIHGLTMSGVLKVKP